MRLRALSTLFLTAVAVGLAGFQPPGGPGKGKGPRFELGKVFPPELRESLKLTLEQAKQVEDLEKEVRTKLDGFLTAEQKQAAESFSPTGRGGPGKGGDRAPAPAVKLPDDPPGPIVTVHRPLVLVPGADGKTMVVTGDAFEGVFGDRTRERFGRGIHFPSADDRDRDGTRAGLATWTVNGLGSGKDRWVRFQIRGLVQDGFAVADDKLFLRVEFFKDGGKNPLDHITHTIYPQVERERKDLADSATNKSLGKATWRTYAMDVRTPFPEVDTLRLGVGYATGSGKGEQAEFWVAEVDVGCIPDPTGFMAPAARVVQPPPALKSLVKIGGRWYYYPRGEDQKIPERFDHTNADQLYYLTDRLEAPFAGNTGAWLKAGYINRAGTTVETDEFLADNVVISFTEKHLVMRSKGLPNHPTGTFPDRTRFLDGNPNVIREQLNTYYLPLEPKVNDKHIAMNADNSNRGLPMGPIGVAVNGVVFFNPFDSGAEEAVWRLDRCCGHPSPTSQYHYHKYPVCVNTMWADDGTGHSPLIGFAFDGYPIYGPYESAGVLAKDAKVNPLNAFNLHEDPARGPHYHVTPGRYPHVIGGYWGEVDSMNRGKKGPRPKE